MLVRGKLAPLSPSSALPLPLSLVPSLKNIEGKSIYSYSLSPPPLPLLEGSILIKYIEEAHKGKEACRGREGSIQRERSTQREVSIQRERST
jgi:hypothetical protein